MTDADVAGIAGAVIVRFDEDGELSYHVFGDERVRLFIVDERSPHDRVYEMTQRDDPATFREIIPSGETIGHSGDERHEAIARRVEAMMDGRPRLSVVPSDKG